MVEQLKMELLNSLNLNNLYSANLSFSINKAKIKKSNKKKGKGWKNKLRVKKRKIVKILWIYLMIKKIKKVKLKRKSRSKDQLKYKKDSKDQSHGVFTLDFLLDRVKQQLFLCSFLSSYHKWQEQVVIGGQVSGGGKVSTYLNLFIFGYIQLSQLLSELLCM